MTSILDFYLSMGSDSADITVFNASLRLPASSFQFSRASQLTAGMAA